ncbi:MAG: hypothetical protein AAFX99_37290, partial [Myxococcota bacterium]
TTPMVFSPNAQQLAVTTRRGDVQLFDTSSGTRTHRLQGHRQPIIALAFNLDGTLLATASQDATVQVWTLPDGALLATTVAVEEDGFITLIPDGPYYRATPNALDAVAVVQHQRAWPLNRWDGLLHRPDHILAHLGLADDVQLTRARRLLERRQVNQALDEEPNPTAWRVAPPSVSLGP